MYVKKIIYIFFNFILPINYMFLHSVNYPINALRIYFCIFRRESLDFIYFVKPNRRVALLEFFLCIFCVPIVRTCKV